jgi:curli biogenesis system outer membrane secretion channel CsgG
MLRRFTAVMVCVLGLITGEVCFAGLGDYPNVAVLGFYNKAAVSNSLSFEDATVVTEYIIDELIRSGKFNVIERDQLAAIMSEHSLNMTGMVNPMSAVAIGNLAGAQYLVSGSVTGLSLKESGLSYENSVRGGAKGTKYKVIANVNLRIIDVETGGIRATGSGEGSSSSTNMEFTLDTREEIEQTITNDDEITGESSEDYLSTTTGAEHTIKIGATEVSQVQVHNALVKASHDAIYGDMGLITRLFGKMNVKK